jgi:hypothetical protein
MKRNAAQEQRLAVKFHTPANRPDAAQPDAIGDSLTQRSDAEIVQNRAIRVPQLKPIGPGYAKLPCGIGPTFQPLPAKADRHCLTVNPIAFKPDIDDQMIAI